MDKDEIKVLAPGCNNNCPICCVELSSTRKMNILLTTKVKEAIKAQAKNSEFSRRSLEHLELLTTQRNASDAEVRLLREINNEVRKKDKVQLRADLQAMMAPLQAQITTLQTSGEAAAANSLALRDQIVRLQTGGEAVDASGQVEIIALQTAAANNQRQIAELSLNIAAFSSSFRLLSLDNP